METGLSNFHRIVVTIIKTTFQRLPPKIRPYRNYNKLYNHKFRETLVKKLSLANTWNNEISYFIDVLVRSLAKNSLLKKKYTRGNHFPFVKKIFSMATIHMSKLRHNFLRNRSNENEEKYSKQQNCSVYLLRRIKKTTTVIVMRKTLLITKSFKKRLPHYFRKKFY